MNEIQIFQNQEFGAIRTISNEQGEALFCAKDVAEALGYSNGRDAVRKHVDGEDKTTVAICDTGYVDDEDVTKRDTPTMTVRNIPS